MNQTDNKIKLFEDIVYGSRYRVSQGKERRLEKENKKTYEDRGKSIAKRGDEIVRRRVELAKRRGYDQMSIALEERQVLVLEKIDSLTRDLIEELKAEAAKYTQTPAYKKSLVASVTESFADLEPGAYKLGMIQKDLDFSLEKIQSQLEPKDFQIEAWPLGQHIIGGHIISDSAGTYNIKRDIGTLIDEKKYEIGKLINNKLVEGA